MPKSCGKPQYGATCGLKFPPRTMMACLHVDGAYENLRLELAIRLLQIISYKTHKNVTLLPTNMDEIIFC